MSYSYMSKTINFGLLGTTAKTLGGGLLAGSIFGVGYAGTKALVDKSYGFNANNVSDEAVSNAVGSGLSATGIYLAGKGMQKIKNIV